MLNIGKRSAVSIRGDNINSKLKCQNSKPHLKTLKLIDSLRFIATDGEVFSCSFELCFI
ncbi:MAG: hypothetical protein AB1414_04520 [bacterium]